MLSLIRHNLNLLSISNSLLILLSNVSIHQYPPHQLFSVFFYASPFQNLPIPFIANTILPTHSLLQIPSQQPLPNSKHAYSNKHISLHTPKKDKELIQLLLRHSIPILRLKQGLHHHLHLLLVFRCQQFLIKRHILILVNAVIYLRLTLSFHPYFLGPVL